MTTPTRPDSTFVVRCISKEIGHQAFYLAAVISRRSSEYHADVYIPKVSVRLRDALRMTKEDAEEVVHKFTEYPAPMTAFYSTLATSKHTYEIVDAGTIAQPRMGRPPQPADRCKHCPQHIVRRGNYLIRVCCFCGDESAASPMHGNHIIDVPESVVVAHVPAPPVAVAPENVISIVKPTRKKRS